MAISNEDMYHMLMLFKERLHKIEEHLGMVEDEPEDSDPLLDAARKTCEALAKTCHRRGYKRGWIFHQLKAEFDEELAVQVYQEYKETL